MERGGGNITTRPALTDATATLESHAKGIVSTTPTTHLPRHPPSGGNDIDGLIAAGKKEEKENEARKAQGKDKVNAQKMGVATTPAVSRDSTTASSIEGEQAALKRNSTPKGVHCERPLR